MSENTPRSALLCLLLVAAPMANAAITLPMPWHKGVSVSYQSTSVEEKRRGARNERSETRETTVLEIAEATPKGYLQVWRSQNPSVQVTGNDGDFSARREFAQKLATRFASLPLKAELDPKGAYLGLRNWQELGAALREMMLPFMAKQAHARPDLAKTDEAKLREMLAPVLERITTQPAINNSMGKQVAIYNFFTAASLAPGKPKSYEDNVASPWSPDIIPTIGFFELTKVDAQAGTVTITWKQAIDPDKGGAVARKIVETISKTKLPDKPGLPDGLKLSDQATVVVDRKSGLPLSLVHRREYTLGNNSSVSTWTLKKVGSRSP